MLRKWRVSVTMVAMLGLSSGLAANASFCWSQCHSLAMAYYQHYGDDLDIGTGIYNWCMGLECGSDGIVW